MGIIINKKSEKRYDWKEIVDGLGLSGFPRSLSKSSKFSFGHKASVTVYGEAHKVICITIPFSPEADFDGDPVFDDIWKALEAYFKFNIILKIYYNDGTELCQE